MLMLSCAFLVFNAFNIATAKSAVLDSRAVILPRPRVDPIDDVPSASSWDDDVPSANSWDDTNTPVYHPWSEVGESGEITPEYAPAARPNYCLDHAPSCEEIADVAREVVENMVNALVTTSSTSTVTSGSQTSTIAGGQVTLMPNYNIATKMSLPQTAFALLNSDEQDMYNYDRLCFYANVERRYEAAARSESSHNRPRNKASPVQRYPLPASSLPPLPTAERARDQRILFKTYLPRQIQSIYAPVPTNGSIPVTTYTTRCHGLGGAAAFTVPYALRVTASTTPIPSAEVDNSASGNVPAESAIVAAVVWIIGLVLLV